MNSSSTAIDRFIAFWQKLDRTSGHYVHPEELHLVEKGPAGPRQLQLDVPPIPVNGCLRTADIVILMANPNFDAQQEADWAVRDPSGAQRLEEVRWHNLFQRHEPTDCPFYDLDPRLAASPGAAYWRRGNKFRDAANALQNAWGASNADVYRELSWRVAVLQMLPYRSKEFNHERLAENCASGREARLLAHALASDPGKLVLCQRRVRQWGFSFPSDQSNLITYDPEREAIGASLSLKSRGGPKMIEKLRAQPPQHAFTQSS